MSGELINYKSNDLLIAKEDAVNSVIEVFKHPIEYRIKCLKEESKSANAEAIANLYDYLQSLEQIKQEWFNKSTLN